jgi:hypothetical protein
MKELKDFPGYFITEDGKVFSAWKRQLLGKGNCISFINYDNLIELKSAKDTKGYFQVRLKQGHKSVNIKNHRLVAKTYIPNPNNLPQVNHIDENKINNHVSNLEWVDNSQNIIHSKCRWVYVIENIITNEIIETININQFSRENHLCPRNLHLTLLGKRKHHKNFKITSKTQFK